MAHAAGAQADFKARQLRTCWKCDASHAYLGLLDDWGPSTDTMVLYHLCQSASWEAALESNIPYKPPTFDQDGFTHLSDDASLLLPIANHFYRRQSGNWVVLCIDEGKLTSEVKFESAAPVGTQPTTNFRGDSSANEQLFPHLYGPINPSAVCDVCSVERDPDGTFLKIAGLDIGVKN